MRVHWHGTVRAERSERFQFIPMEVELHARALHFGIDSGPEKALRATESVKKVGQFDFMQISSEKRSRQPIAVRFGMWRLFWEFKNMQIVPEFMLHLVRK